MTWGWNMIWPHQTISLNSSDWIRKKYLGETVMFVWDVVVSAGPPPSHHTCPVTAVNSTHSTHPPSLHLTLHYYATTRAEPFSLSSSLISWSHSLGKRRSILQTRRVFDWGSTWPSPGLVEGRDVFSSQWVSVRSAVINTALTTVLTGYSWWQTTLAQTLSAPAENLLEKTQHSSSQWNNININNFVVIFYSNIILIGHHITCCQIHLKL